MLPNLVHIQFGSARAQKLASSAPFPHHEIHAPSPEYRNFQRFLNWFFCLAIYSVLSSLTLFKLLYRCSFVLIAWGNMGGHSLSYHKLVIVLISKFKHFSINSQMYSIVATKGYKNKFKLWKKFWTNCNFLKGKSFTFLINCVASRECLENESHWIGYRVGISKSP